MDHIYFKQLQDEILGKVLAILKADSNVIGVVNTGSFVVGENDAFSDIDVDCYIRDGNLTSIKPIIEKVTMVSPVLSKLWIYGRNTLFLFENGIRLDLNFNKPSEIPNQKYYDCKILYDPDNALSEGFDKNPKKIEQPHPRWNPEEFEYIDWYFWMFRQIYCWVKRAEQGNHKSFNKLSSSVDSLAQIRNGLIGMKLWIHGSWDYLTNIDLEFAKRISVTYPHLEPKEILSATRLLLQELKLISAPYCKKRGIEFPTKKFDVMDRILDDFDGVKS